MNILEQEIDHKFIFFDLQPSLYIDDY